VENDKKVAVFTVYSVILSKKWKNSINGLIKALKQRFVLGVLFLIVLKKSASEF
jgi:hypothetical protein